jgi:hypothetical protein
MCMDELELFVVNCAGNVDSRYSIPNQLEVEVLTSAVYIHVN